MNKQVKKSKTNTDKVTADVTGHKKNNMLNDVKISENCSETIIQRVQTNPSSLTKTDVIVLQRTLGNQAVGRFIQEIKGKENETIQKKENKTGLPDRLKEGLEVLSGQALVFGNGDLGLERLAVVERSLYLGL